MDPRAEEAYHKARKIRLGEHLPDERETAFASALASEFGVRPLHSYLREMDEEDDWELLIIFERLSDRTWEQEGKEHPGAQPMKAMAALWRQCTPTPPELPEDTAPQQVTVLFFEQLSNHHAAQQIPQVDIMWLRQHHQSALIRDVHQGAHGGLNIFFQTDRQLVEDRDHPEVAALRKAYYSLISPFDEFSFIRPESIPLSFFSMETIDQDFEGSLFVFYAHLRDRISKSGN